MEPVSPALAGRFLAPKPPGKSQVESLSLGLSTDVVGISRAQLEGLFNLA